MIRIATLDKHIQSLSDQEFDRLSDHLAQENIDIVCCRENKSGSDCTQTGQLAKNLDMTYTSSNLCWESGKKNVEKETTCCSILTGKNVWMLNSGSLTVTEENGNTRRAQFGVIRSNGESILLLNAQFTESGPALKKQIQALFSLPIFAEQYGAVIFNADVPHDKQAYRDRESAEKQHFKIHTADTGQDSGMAPSVLTAKEQPPAKVKICYREDIALPIDEAKDLFSCSGNITSLEIERLPRQKKQKRYSPISFRERWLGSRDGDRAFAF